MGSRNRENGYQKVYIAGDSIVKYQGLNLQEKLGTSSARSICIPGGKINHIANALDDSGKSESIVISVGTNEIGKSGYVSITEKYTNLFDKLKDKNTKVVIVGILPRLKESSQWASRAIAVNNWLRQQCASYRFSYLDLWECMYNNTFYYSRDGIHLNFQGRAIFTKVIVNKLRSLKNSFLGQY